MLNLQNNEIKSFGIRLRLPRDSSRVYGRLGAIARLVSGDTSLIGAGVDSNPMRFFFDLAKDLGGLDLRSIIN